MKNSLVNQLVANYKKTLNPSSKWFTQDVADFKTNISRLSVKELEQKLGRISQYVNDNSFLSKQVNKEIKNMDKAGMFNINKMKAANCMD